MAIILLVTGLAVAGTSRLAGARLAHGTVDLEGCHFVFGEQKCYPGNLVDDPVDIALIIIVEPPLGPMLSAWHDGGILAVPDSTVENITWAPSDMKAYGIGAPPVYNRAYVFKTGDGFYAKFAFRSEYSGQAIIEYWVQIDHTNILVDPTPTQASTWGRVKSLYR
jgi:hypothetical protein